MAITPARDLQIELSEARNSDNYLITTVFCHGRLVSETSSTLKEAVKPLIERGGGIVIDFADIAYVDSLGLGTLVGLKASAIHKGFCTVQLVNLSPRIKELLKLTRLKEFLAG